MYHNHWDDDDLKGGRRRSMSLPDYSMPPTFGFEDGSAPTSDSEEEVPFNYRQGGAYHMDTIPEGETTTVLNPSRLKYEHSPKAKSPRPNTSQQPQPQQTPPLQYPQQPPQYIAQQSIIPHFTLNLQGLYSEFQEDAIRFDVMYQVHFHKIFEAVKQIRLDSIRDEVLSFWPKTRRFFSLFQNPLAMHQILNIDSLFYQSLINLLIPDPFHYLPTEVSTLAIELSRLLPVWLHNATQFALPLAFSEEKIRVVKQYCTVLHKRALINNLGGRVSNQLQSGQESYGLNDGSGKRKADEIDSKYSRMISDWQQIDFSFISSAFAFESGEWELVENVGYHPEPLVPPETIDQMAMLLQRRAGINEWSEWLRDAVLSRCPPDLAQGDPNSMVGRPFHQLVLKWSLFLSNILTELTLLQAKSVKQFRLLFQWIEAVLSHQMEIQFKTDANAKTSAKPEDGLGFPSGTGSFWREQTRQLKQQVEFLTGKIALLEQQLQATKLAPSTPPTYFPTSPNIHRPDEGGSGFAAQSFSPRINPFSAPEGYSSLPTVNTSAEGMPVGVRRPSFPFSVATTHRPRTNSQPSPEIRFSDWDEENEDENFENLENDANNDDSDVAMKKEERGVGEQSGSDDVGGRTKRRLRKARSGSGLERRRVGGRGGGMYIDNDTNNTSTTTPPSTFLTPTGLAHNPQQPQQDKSPRPGVSPINSPVYHVAHTQSFSQPTSPTLLVQDLPIPVGASPLGGSGGLPASDRYLSAPVPRGGRIRSNSNPMPFVDAPELWVSHTDRGRKPLSHSKHQEGGFPFTSPTTQQFEESSSAGGQLLNSMSYYNKNYGKTGE